MGGEVAPSSPRQVIDVVGREILYRSCYVVAFGTEGFFGQLDVVRGAETLSGRRSLCGSLRWYARARGSLPERLSGR